MGVRVIVGLGLTLVGIVLVLIPYEVAEVLGRPMNNSLDVIETRVAVGGIVIGLGAFVTARGQLRPWLDTFAELVKWSMLALAVTRTFGIAVDGGPDNKQWFWLGVEVVLCGAATGYLFWKRRRLAQAEADDA